jgi:myo-inositol-1(or 4)-monophosphatase
MQFPCADALSYSHLCEGKIDVVFQGQIKFGIFIHLIPIIKAAGGLLQLGITKMLLKLEVF